MLGSTIRNALSIVLVGALVSMVAVAGLFVYMPASISLRMVSPPYWFEPSTSGGTETTIGPNATSATVNITLAPTTELLKNPDFYYDADPWMYASNINGITVYWQPSDTGSSGGVAIAQGSVTFTAWTWYYVLLLQNFTVPTTVSQVNLSIRYMLVSTPSGGYLINLVYAEIQRWNSTGGTWDTIASTYTTIRTGSSYTNYNTTLSLSPALSPGETYRILAGYAGNSYFSDSSGTLDFRVDWIRLEMGAPYYVFAGEAVRVNGTIYVYAQFYVTSYYSNSTTINADIYLENLTSRTTAIQIRNGNLTSTSTSFILLKPSGSPIYVSGRISVLANSTTADGSVVVVRGFLHYTNGAFHVYYPVTIRIGG